MTISRRIVAEALGTALLLAAVVGSGIMGERLAGGNVAIALLANTVATGAMLVTLIFTFDPVSGAHFNPAVTLADASQRGIAWRLVPLYIAGQVAGAFLGVMAVRTWWVDRHTSCSVKRLYRFRSMSAPVAHSFLASSLLPSAWLSVIWGCARLRSEAVPVAVALYITGAYWFTASTSFANPAVTVARAFTDTFAGIRPLDVPGFIMAQLAGAFMATALFRWLVPTPAFDAKQVVFPHTTAIRD